MPGPPREATRRALVLLLVTSSALLAVRLFAATRVGLGDSEALYASYALHPQPAYLDHPGLVGALARTLGGGTAPSPLAAHLATSVLATAVPWVMALACRGAGATWRRSLLAAWVLALAPEIAVGLFAMTPDLPLAIAWTAALGLAAAGLRGRPGAAGSSAAFAGAGLCAGVAAASKATGVLLLVALAVAYLLPAARRHARSVAPWAGLLAGLVVLAPVAAFEARTGWPMLRHRLVETQAGAGVSLRNLGALVGGQLVYVSPVLAGLAVLAARQAWRDRRDAVGGLLVACGLVPLVPLVVLAAWSRVAEPHWIAPALLTLVPAAARGAWAPSRRLVAAGAAVAGAMVVLVHAWVLVPALARLAPASSDARLDIANELYGWPDAVAAVRAEALAEERPLAEPGDLVVAGPHWVVCAQLDAALRDRWPVGCNTPVRDDFDDWLPRARWKHADTIVWVSDGRFDEPGGTPSYAPLLRTFVPLRSREVPVERGGRVVRTFTVTVLSRRAAT